MLVAGTSPGCISIILSWRYAKRAFQRADVIHQRRRLAIANVEQSKKESAAVAASGCTGRLLVENANHCLHNIINIGEITIISP